MKEKLDFNVPGSLALRYALVIGEMMGAADEGGAASVELLAKESRPCLCGAPGHLPIRRLRRLQVYTNSGRLYARAEHEASGEEGTAAYVRSGVEVALRGKADLLELEAVQQAVAAAALLTEQELAVAGVRLLPEVLQLGPPELQASFAPLMEGGVFIPQSPRKEELN